MELWGVSDHDISQTRPGLFQNYTPFDIELNMDTQQEIFQDLLLRVKVFF